MLICFKFGVVQFFKIVITIPATNLHTNQRTDRTKKRRNAGNIVLCSTLQSTNGKWPICSIKALHGGYCTKTLTNIPVVSSRRRGPTGAENVERLAVNVIVHEARIDAECTHQQDYIATSEEYVPYLSTYSCVSNTHCDSITATTEQHVNRPIQKTS